MADVSPFWAAVAVVGVVYLIKWRSNPVSIQS